MLDTITKRRIDDCRDILVGKLPDPKSQIEQITIGLIYKFMDDMDKEAIELGGNAKFFSDYTIPDPNDPKKEIIVPFEKYSWDNLFNTKVSASEMLKLYMEAIEGMVKNPNIPELFANIFKNAYLPYRDPETLKMFLKTIGEFEYTHSEKLGDAFEYLLSVMGSQGDAGQFRTPRHIIDFLVAAVDPGKNDTVLDPACGTAGFLISAFKHIKEQNNNDLKPEEQKNLIKNFMGYDISPDMVRLSLVNLYLHGFTDPHIFEYDTLSSEERWDETFDVILANPPFMSPKGGIRPHKKFSIQSNRSEVLFVDYIAEHLNPKGRAGIIVPEGIIFQSGTAYKALRKMLVDKYLYAVVSLPAGVFNPYSGVKTSILLMDADLAKKSKDILFVKIDNDGYSLGSQRTPVKGSQLDETIETLNTFRKRSIDGKQFENTISAQAISKAEIGKSGEYNLSGLTYNKVIHYYTDTFKKVSLKELCDLQSGFAFDSNLFSETEGFPLIRIRDIKTNSTKTKYTGEFKKELIVKNGDLIIGMDGEFNTCIWKGNDALLNQRLCRLINFRNTSKEYVYRMIQKKLKEIEDSTFAVTVKHISGKQIQNIEIPLPPFAIQQEIVTEIESYQKIIDGAKMVVDNYKPRIEIDADWEIKKIGTLCSLSTGGTPSSTNEQYYTNGNIRWLVSGDIHKGEIFDCEGRITEKALKESNTKYLPLNSVLIALNGQGKTRGTVALLRCEATCNQSLVAINSNNKDILLPEFLYYQLKSKYQQIRNITGENQRSGLNMPIIRDIEITLPPITTQQEIVSQIEKEQALVNANKELIEIYGQKIKERIEKVWGEKEEIVLKRLSNDLFLAMMLKQMERKFQLNYGEVATQKTVFHLNTFTNQKLDYSFLKYKYGTYSSQLREDLLKNPYLTKTQKGSGEVFLINNSKEKEVLEALSNPDNKEFVDALNEVLRIYQTPLINKETENIELLNTVSKVILDKQTIDLDGVYTGMEDWEINQNGFKTKAHKFTKGKTKRMIDLIVKLELLDKLIKIN